MRLARRRINTGTRRGLDGEIFHSVDSTRFHAVSTATLSIRFSFISLSISQTETIAVSGWTDGPRKSERDSKEQE